MLLLFFCAWIIFNGRITVEILALGVVISALVFAFVCKFMDYSAEKEKGFYKKFFYLTGYAILLIKEIIVANVQVVHMIWTQKEVVEPAIVKFRVNLETDLARVILANSITLTPGTITVLLEENEYTVHCLDKSLAEGMEDSVFVRMLEKIERKG